MIICFLTRIKYSLINLWQVLMKIVVFDQLIRHFKFLGHRAGPLPQNVHLLPINKINTANITTFDISKVFKHRFAQGVMGLLIFAIGFTYLGCYTLGQPTARATHLTGPDVQEAQMEQYYGPKATIAVGDFQVKAAGATVEIGDGLREMLLTAMFNSNRFIVLDRQAMQDILLEQDLAASGRVKAGSGPATGQLEGAELYVYGVVSEFMMEESGARLNFAVPKAPFLFGGGAKNAHLAIDLRMVDTTTSRILFATRVEGKASDFDARVATRFGSRSGGVPVSLAAFKNTPMEKAIRVTIDKAIETMASQTPNQYFHHPR